MFQKEFLSHFKARFDVEKSFDKFEISYEFNDNFEHRLFIKERKKRFKNKIQEIYNKTTNKLIQLMINNLQPLPGISKIKNIKNGFYIRILGDLSVRIDIEVTKQTNNINIKLLSFKDGSDDNKRSKYS